LTMSGSITAVRVRHQEFRTQSGDDSEQNLIALCSRCHATVHHG
jgi:5-methylcytosine-specific restriction endonuclease McrA